MQTDEEIFSELIHLANEASENSEVPIAAALVKGGEIISIHSNETEKRGNFISHSEILCLTEASQKLGSKYLIDCVLYVTLEPCKMCYYAARLCRVSKIKFLLPSDKFGRNGDAYSPIECEHYENSKLSEGALRLMRSFFEKKR